MEECQKHSSAGHIYLTIFQFYRLVFNPGGNFFRFEVESFQEGENDTIQAKNNLKERRFKALEEDHKKF